MLEHVSFGRHSGHDTTQTGRTLRRLVVVDLAVDLVGVRADVGPGVDEVLSAQSRKGSQQVGLGRPESAGLLQDPDRDPELLVGPIPASDTQLAIAYTGLRQVAFRLGLMLRHAFTGNASAPWRSWTGMGPPACVR